MFCIKLLWLIHVINPQNAASCSRTNKKPSLKTGRIYCKLACVVGRAWGNTISVRLTNFEKPGRSIICDGAEERMRCAAPEHVFLIAKKFLVMEKCQRIIAGARGSSCSCLERRWGRNGGFVRRNEWGRFHTLRSVVSCVLLSLGKVVL